MKRYLRYCLLAALTLPVFAVLSIATTMLLFPFWSWLESFSGIESVGHSGPAAWCYLLVFLVILVAPAAADVVRTRVRRDRQRTA